MSATHTIAPPRVLFGCLFMSVATSCAAPSPAAVPPRAPVEPAPTSASTPASTGSAVGSSTSGVAPPSASETAAAPKPPEPEKAPAAFVPIPPRRRGGFPGIAFAEVRAYAFDLEVNERPVCEGPLEDDGRLCATVVRPGVVLSPEQVGRLTKVLASPRSFGGSSSCFLPHHGFVYFDEAGTPVATISVCFLCDMLEPRPAVPSEKAVHGSSALGLSELGRDELQRLCRELGLPKCDARSPDDFRP